MKRRVALIEFSIFNQFPLVSGYLHAYAAADPDIDAAFEFAYFQQEMGRLNYADALRAIRALRAEIVCLSTYVWNVGVVRRVINDLRDDPHIRHIVLGGHQISNQIERYVDRSDAKTIVINGQGEIPFRALLRQLLQSNELAPLRGLSFYRDGELWNGGEAPMLTRLDDIPSPFLNGHFDRMECPIAVFETNRGCPYQCTFCTWGGDTMKVAKFSMDRIREELLWIAKRSVLFLYLADANWGMLERDIEISEYIARLKKTYGSPWGVYYAAAKNKPRGSIACIEKFHEGGVITSQAIGIQSMNPATLSLVKRQNIKTSAFVEMFQQLNARRIDSYCELIWPLPGETLDTLKRGFEDLMDLGAPTTIMYPAVLINNAALTQQADEFGMECIDSDDWMSELKIVKATRFADRAAVESGFWFYYAWFALGNLDLHKAMLRYLRATTGKGYAQVVTEFADKLQAAVATSAYAQMVADIFAHEAHGTLLTIGRIASHLGHEHRFETIADVARFVIGKEAGDATPRNLAMMALWGCAVPKLFANTPDSAYVLMELLEELASARGLTFSSLASVRKAAWNVTLTVDDSMGVWSEVVKFFGMTAEGPITDIEIEHPATTFVPYDPQDSTRNFHYAHGMIERMGLLAVNIRVRTADSHAPRRETTSATDARHC